MAKVFYSEDQAPQRHEKNPIGVALGNGKHQVQVFAIEERETNNGNIKSLIVKYSSLQDSTLIANEFLVGALDQRMQKIIEGPNGQGVLNPNYDKAMADKYKFSTGKAIEIAQALGFDITQGFEFNDFVGRQMMVKITPHKTDPTREWVNFEALPAASGQPVTQHQQGGFGGNLQDEIPF